MAPTLTALQHAYQKHHPEIHFKDTLHGTGTAMAGIITGASDIAYMGRPTTVNEVIGFEWVHRTKPVGIQIMSGALKGEGKSPALAVFVSSKNPVTRISMAQLATILGCLPTSSHPTWSAAGATGAWATKPIHAYLYDMTTGTGAYLQQAVEPGKDCWNWDIVHEYKDTTHASHTTTAAQQIIAALKADPDGLAITSPDHAAPGLKAIPIVVHGNPIHLTAASIIDGTYPLARPVFIYIEHPADKPVDPKVSAYLRFILSEEGQQIIAQHGDYLPLNSPTIQSQLKKLE